MTSSPPPPGAGDYSAARDGCAVAPLPRELLAVTGPDRQKLLHSVLSNDLKDRRPGQGCLAALMDVKGHLLAFLRASVAKDAVYLETPRGRRELVESQLTHYRVAAPVRFAARPEATLGLFGPRARATLAALGCEVPDLAAEDHVEAALASHPVRVIRARDLPAQGLVLHVPLAGVEAILGALRDAGAVDLSDATLDALRIEDGRPWYGPDVTEENLLHETGLVPEYHSSAKGCYVGQEVIARLEARGGNVNKRLRGLRLDGPVNVGTTISFEGQETGRVTTAAVSPRLGAIAMGYVHRSRSEPGTEVTAGDVRATVAPLPLVG